MRSGRWPTWCSSLAIHSRSRSFGATIGDDVTTLDHEGDAGRVYPGVDEQVGHEAGLRGAMPPNAAGAEDQGLRISLRGLAAVGDAPAQGGAGAAVRPDRRPEDHDRPGHAAMMASVAAEG